MWTQQAMVNRIDWEKRRFDGRRKLSVKDESEFRKNDLAAKWLARKEAQLAADKERRAAEKAKRAAQKAKPITTPQRSSWKGKKLKRGPITTPRRSNWQGKKLA